MAEIVQKHPNIERILAGHIHLPTHTMWHGTIISTAPGMGMRLGLDLTMKKDSEFFLEAPAYQLHHWTPQQNFIIHTIRIENADGPYPFAEQV